MYRYHVTVTHYHHLDGRPRQGIRRTTGNFCVARVARHVHAFNSGHQTFNACCNTPLFQRGQVLLPLVNIPMLEYTLESLAAAGVREILVVCCAHATQIDAYLASSPWSQRTREVKVTTITVEDAFSAGDALRRVRALALVRSDPFVLISGDVVSNMELSSVIREHKAARAADKSVIMTVIFKRARPGARTNPKNSFDCRACLSCSPRTRPSSTHIKYLSLARPTHCT